MSRKELDDWILHMGAELERLSHELAPSGPKLARQKEWAPRVDVLETPVNVLVKVELAAVRGGQFVLQYNGERNVLLVRGERRDEPIARGTPTASHQLEIEYGPFSREVRLPDVPLDVSRAHAQLSNGMLTIVIPKLGTAHGQEYVVERTVTVRRLR